MKNAGQIGFDFCDATPAYHLGADWTWTKQPRRRSEHMARLANSLEGLSQLVGVPHELFSKVLDSVFAEHERQVKWCAYDRNDDCLYDLWGHGMKLTAAEYDSLIMHTMKHDGMTIGGVEYKVRTRPSSWSNEMDVTVAIHARGIGSVRIGRYWGKDGTWHSMGFTHIERDPLFLEGYRDGAAHAYCSEAVWAPAYSAQLIAEAHKKIPSVRTFKFGGREYVNTGARHCGDYSACSAWAITPVEDWTGDTFSYAELTQAWDRGAAERGDERGLLVRVRGQLCVLESYMTVYDDQPRQILAVQSDQDADVDEDELDDEGLDDGDVEEEGEADCIYA
jgi:hypothetical protein